MSAEILRAIAEQEGIALEHPDAEPWVGGTSCVYPFSTGAVLKVPHADANAERSLRIDLSVGPVMRAAGVRTPHVVTFDDSRRRFPWPYAVMERVPGVPLSAVDRAGVDHAGTWRNLGRDLALVHEYETPHATLDELRTFDQSPDVDPRPWLDDLTRAECFSPEQGERLAAVLDRLAPAALTPLRKRLCHGDVNAANVIVNAGTLRYEAIVDWAGAGWLDPAWDLAAIPLPAVPHVLNGHRQVAPFERDETAEARALWCHVQFALYGLRRPHSSATQPSRNEATRLIEKVDRFIALVGPRHF